MAGGRRSKGCHSKGTADESAVSHARRNTVPYNMGHLDPQVRRPTDWSVLLLGQALEPEADEEPG